MLLPYRTTLIAVVLCFLFGLTSANARHGKAEQQAFDQSPITVYESFLKQTDVVIVTRSYTVGSLGGGWDVSAKVAWALGDMNKVYALDIGGHIIDFGRLKETQDGLDKMVEAVNSSFDKLNAASMSYSSKVGISASYYAYKDSSGKLRRNLYVTMGSFVTQGENVEPLVKIRNLMGQGREKLVSLGAK